MSYILAFINITSTSLLLTVIFKKRIDITLPIGFTINVLTLFLFGLFTNLSTGYYFSWTYLLVVIFLIIKSKKIEIKELVFTPGLLVFTFFFIAFFVITKNHQFKCVDEFYHLGEMVRENIRLNNFYSINESNLIYHKEYPPFFSLIETLFCQFDSFTFTEKSCYRGLLIYELSLFMPLFRRLNFKKEDLVKIIATVLIIIASMVFIHLNDSDYENAVVLNSIYVDWCMILIFASIFVKGYVVIDYELYDFVSASVMMSAMLLTKQIGLALYALAFAYIILIQIIRGHASFKNILKTLFFMILAPFLMYFLWHEYVGQFDIAAQFSISSIRPQDLLPIYRFEKGQPWQFDSIYNFIWCFKYLPILYKPFEMSYLSSSICLTLIMLFVLFISEKNKVITYITPLVYLLGAMLYAFAILNLYVFTFGEIEGVQLSCFNRYMGSYVYGGLIICVLLTINNFTSDKHNIKIIIALVVSLLFVNYQDLKYLIPRTNERTVRDVYEEHFVNGLGSLLLVDELDIIPNYLDYTMVDYFYMNTNDRPHDKIIKVNEFSKDDLNNYENYAFISLNDLGKTESLVGHKIEVNKIYTK